MICRYKGGGMRTHVGILLVSVFAAGMVSVFVAGMNPLLAAQATTATILGTVTDSSGAAVPGATVMVRNTGTDISQTTVSDERGRYRVPSLNVGQYEVKAELQGFQTSIRKEIVVTVGREVVVDFVLAP